MFTECVHVAAGVSARERVCAGETPTDVNYTAEGNGSKVYQPYGRGSAPHRADG